MGESMPDVRDLDGIKLAFLEAYEAGQVPTLEELVARHPQHVSELTDFVLTFLELQQRQAPVQEERAASESTQRIRNETLRRVFRPGTLPEVFHEEGVTRRDMERAV